MKPIHEVLQKPTRPERIIQFGEGGFLRGFADWMLQTLNDSGNYNGSAVIVQPIEQGMCEALSLQNCLYTHIMRGLRDGSPATESTVVDCISRCVNPYQDWDAYLALAQSPDLRVIISNTTEAGIAYDPSDRPDMAPPGSFPAKLTWLLHERFRQGLPGFLLLPCELIDRNGDKLKECVLQYARDWNLGKAFSTWLETENEFCCTLVDRIVTGYPRGEELDLPYRDDLLDTSELFHLWVIEGDKRTADLLPLHKAGLNVIWTDDLEPYRTRKVRILNGAHTALVPVGLLNGFGTVKSCVDDVRMGAFLRQCVYEEIIPALDLPREALTAYADDVFTRFSNPYLNHYLSSIALNSVSKFRVRVLPSILAYHARFGNYPPGLVRSLAALLRLYRTDMANDAANIVSFLRTATVREALAADWLWGQDLSFLAEEVARFDAETPSC